VPAELAFVVKQGLAIGKATLGAFDITLGAQVNAWGFGPAGMAGLSLDATPSTGIAALEVQSDPPALRKSARLSLDLSGIAKGYGVDRMAMVLEQAGINHYLVTLDGELRCKGRKPGADGAWTIALDAPIPGEHRIWDRLEPRDGALATSGDYRHFRVVEGKALAHTIDPATGRPLDNAVASVTVQAPECWRADAWATALMVMGPQKGVAIAQARNLAALFLIRSGVGIEEISTGDFDRTCNRAPAP
jgi:thiamine biosynthesis lipoprotein